MNPFITSLDLIVFALVLSVIISLLCILINLFIIIVLLSILSESQVACFRMSPKECAKPTKPKPTKTKASDSNPSASEEVSSAVPSDELVKLRKKCKQQGLELDGYLEKLNKLEKQVEAHKNKPTDWKDETLVKMESKLSSLEEQIKEKDSRIGVLEMYQVDIKNSDRNNRALQKKLEEAELQVKILSRDQKKKEKELDDNDGKLFYYKHKTLMLGTSLQMSHLSREEIEDRLQHKLSEIEEMKITSREKGIHLKNATELYAQERKDHAKSIQSAEGPPGRVDDTALVDTLNDLIHENTTFLTKEELKSEFESLRQVNDKLESFFESTAASINTLDFPVSADKSSFEISLEGKFQVTRVGSKYSFGCKSVSLQPSADSSTGIISTDSDASMQESENDDESIHTSPCKKQRKSLVDLCGT